MNMRLNTIVFLTLIIFISSFTHTSAQLSDLNPDVMRIAVLMDTDQNQLLNDVEILNAILLWIKSEPVQGSSDTISDEIMLTMIQWWILEIPLGSTQPPIIGPPDTPPSAPNPARLSWTIDLVEDQGFYPFPNFISEVIPRDAVFEEDDIFTLPDRLVRVIENQGKTGIFIPLSFFDRVDGWRTLLNVIDNDTGKIVAELDIFFAAPPPPPPSEFPRPPRIVDLDFPTVIRGDGTPQPLTIEFEDPNGDIEFLSLETLQGPSQGQPPQVVELEGAAGLTEGVLSFGIFCVNPSSTAFIVVHRLKLIDEENLEDVIDFSYQCMPA